MQSKNSKKIKTIFCLSLLFLITSSCYADANLADKQQACKQDGGNAERLSFIINYGANGIISGQPKWFCSFDNNHGLEIIGLDTLTSNQPNLAATAYRNAPADGYATPNPNRYDTNYCERLGGTAVIGQYEFGGGYVDAPLGQLTICVFADGSMVDAWNLLHKRVINNVPVDLTPYFASPVLPINPTDLWGK